MPKNRKKGQPPSQANNVQEDDEGASIASDQTESTAHLSDEEGPTEEEAYEQKLKEALDLALEKSVHTRTNALIALTTALQKRVVTSLAVEQWRGLLDVVERSVRKGRGPEQVAAARLASLLVLTLASTPEGEQVYQTLVPLLQVAVTDPSGPKDGRTECAYTLALCTFMVAHEVPHITAVMNTLHSVFAASLPKGNGELPNHPPAVSALHSAALNGFCLLLCLMSPQAVHGMADKLAKEMFDLLGVTDLDLRIQAGEGLALLYETTRSHDPRYRWCREKEMCALLNELATDSHKFRAKKDRKQQRASFRDVVRAVEGREEEVVEETVSLGSQLQREELVLDSWSMRLQYHSLCRVLTQGLSTHFTLNTAVRDTFGLGPPPAHIDPVVAALARRGQKKNNRESPASKARQMARNKSRDNRAAAKDYDD